MNPTRALFLLVLLTVVGRAQLYPDRLYYKFDEGTGAAGPTLNSANPQVGAQFATVTGHTLAPGAGQFGGGLVGTTTSPGTAILDTGWTTAFGTGSWTISFWVNASVAPTSSLYYIFGDSTVGGFRCFFNGAAGVGSCVLRGGFTDVFVTGAGLGGPHVVTYVYDATVPQIRGYLDGVLVSTVAQVPLTLNGTATLKVAGYTSASTYSNNVPLDEFRVYSRALTGAEIAASWNIELFDINVLSVNQTAPMVGDLSISVASLSPTATEGWMLLSGDVSGVTGTGPLLGIRPDAITWSFFLTQPLLDGNPFHFPVPSIFGGFPTNPFVLPPGSTTGLTGSTLDLVLLLIRPGFVYDSRSQTVRYTFQ